MVISGDDVSLYDPEDVLDRFMTKQAHNRCVPTIARLITERGIFVTP